jgi:DNA-binding MarR family transcriptional regulator
LDSFWEIFDMTKQAVERENNNATILERGGKSGAVDLTDALAVANSLRPVLLRLNRSLRHEGDELGVTSTQSTLLAAINRSPGIGLGDLAVQEHISAPTLVIHIDNLEKAGLVERTRSDPQDRRRVGLRLTPAGLKVWQKLRERRTAWLASRLATLSPADLAAIANAIEPLQRLVQREESGS